MKVAVSIPDPIFAEAERLAKQFGTSRSDLFARALGEFIGQHAPDRVTQALDKTIEGLAPRAEALAPQADEFAAQAARRAFSQTEW